MNVFANVKIPKLIYEVETTYNGLIQVFQTGETLKVRVSGFTQSMSPDAPSAQKMVWGKISGLLKEKNPDVKNILVFGLGGGTMQHFLAREFPGIDMTSVEIDPAMVQIARDYFSLDSLPNHKLINDDACRVVIAPEEFGIKKEQFEAVVVDIFKGSKFPDLGSSGNFLAGLKSLVKPGGLVLFNRIYLNDFQDDVNTFAKLLSNFFADVDTVVVPGYTNSDNLIIHCRA